MPFKIEVFTEITCPWCLIGLRRLDNVLSRDVADLDVEIEHHPVMLLPDVPDGGIEMIDLLRQRHGITDPAPAWAHAEMEARMSGLSLSLARQPFVYRTDRAHTLVRHAPTFGGKQHQLAVAITEAYFLEIRDIGDVEVLVQIAERFGFTAAVARAIVTDEKELQETSRQSVAAMARGVRSVPTFHLQDGTVLRGPTQVVLEDAIRRAAR